MSSEAMSMIAAVMSAIAAIAALRVAHLSLGETRRAAAAAERQAAHAMDLTLQGRLDPMYPGLRRVLGHLDDGVPREVRAVLIPFFVLFSDAFAAHRDALLDERDWHGFSAELGYWAQRAPARRAWKAFRRQTWTEGFADYVDVLLDGPSTYPEVDASEQSRPEVDWPTDQDPATSA